MSASADIVWLRDDFRLDDQPAIDAVANRRALFVYIHDPAGAGARPLGEAAKWRLAESLTAMESGLSARGARLDIIKGDAEETILALAAAANASRGSSARRTARRSAFLPPSGVAIARSGLCPLRRRRPNA